VLTLFPASTALPAGTLIEKIESKPEDLHRDGARGRVVAPMVRAGFSVGYYVEWDDMPGVPCYIAPFRIRAILPQ
jgi:hypothetical protein